MRFLILTGGVVQIQHILRAGYYDEDEKNDDSCKNILSYYTTDIGLLFPLRRHLQKLFDFNHDLVHVLTCLNKFRVMEALLRTILLPQRGQKVFNLQSESESY